MAAIAGLSTIVLGSFQAEHLSDVVRSSASMERALIAETLAGQLETQMDRELRSVEGLAAVLDARGGIEDPDAATEILIEFRERYADTQYIVLGSENGVGITSSDLERSAAGVDYSDRDYFRALREHRRSVISRVQVGRLTRVPNIHIAAPLGGSAVRGYVSMSIDLRPMLDTARRAVRRIPGAHAIVWDWERRVVLDTRTESAGQIRILDDAPLYADAPPKFTDVRHHRDEFGEEIDGAASRATVGPKSWTVLVTQPSSVAMQTTNAAWREAIVLVMAVLAIGLLLSILVARWTARPIVDLSRAAESIQTQGADTQVFLPDETRFRPSEAVELARSLGRMVARLRAHSEQLETLVQERTRELEVARNDALDASRHKSQFIANMSHEIRTPMNGVLGMTELLVDRTDTPELREYAEAAHSSAIGLLDLLNEILDFSKIDADRMTLDDEPFDLEAELELVIDTFRGTTSKRDVELVFDMEPEVPSMVVGDAHRLRQIVANLVGNAMKFTERGFVTLRVSSEIAGDRGRFFLRVIDTGVGIPSNRIDTVFEAFAQGDASTTRRFGGTGLGLPIARRLARMMGGDITVTSVHGVGSTFEVEVDLALAPEASPRIAAEVDGAILVCAPDEEVRVAMVHQLARIGLRGLPAGSGDEAAAIASTEPVVAAMIDHLLLRDVISRLPETRFIRWAALGHRFEPCSLCSATLMRPSRRERLREAIEAAVLGRATPTAEERPKQFAGRVLAVDDNKVNQRVLERRLETFGLEVVIASNGREAIEHLATGPFDLVLMDCQMPVMDGFEATRRIRATESTGTRIPIVALTANASSSDRKACLDAGMDEHLAKPVTQGELRKVLERWLSVETEVGDAREHSNEYAAALE